MLFGIRFLCVFFCVCVFFVFFFYLDNWSHNYDCKIVCSSRFFFYIQPQLEYQNAILTSVCRDVLHFKRRLSIFGSIWNIKTAF